MLTGIFWSVVSITLHSPPRSRARTSARRGGARSHVQVGDFERVLLDELPARLDLVAHQDGEDRVRRDRVLDAHLEELAGLRVHGRLPELLGVHLPKALVALD